MDENRLRKILREVANGKGGWAYQIEIAVKILLPLLIASKDTKTNVPYRERTGVLIAEYKEVAVKKREIANSELNGNAKEIMNAVLDLLESIVKDIEGLG